MPKTKPMTSGTPSKKTSKKRAKDPHAPKRYRTAYLLFSAEKREQVKVMFRIDLHLHQNGCSSKTILAQHRKRSWLNWLLNGKVLMLQYVLCLSSVARSFYPSSSSSSSQTKQRCQKLSDAEKSDYEEKLAAYRSEQGDKQSADKENHKKKKTTTTTKSSKKDEILDDDHEESMED